MFKKTVGKPLEKVLDILGEIFAFITIAALAFIFINAQFNFVTNALVLKILAYIQTYATIVVVGIVGLEFVIDKGLILTIIYLVLLAVVVIFSFLPDVRATIVGALQSIA